MKIILPKTYYPRVFDPLYPMPFFFLAGPVLGGGDWQKKCCELLKRKCGNFTAAIPCRYGRGHPLNRFKVRDSKKRTFDRQLAWERHHIWHAAIIADGACLLFWLGCESKKEPRTDGHPYAMDTRREIGEAIGWIRMCRNYFGGTWLPRVIVGADRSFPGLSQIQRSFDDAIGSVFKIHTSLEKTVEAAIKRARKVRF